MRRVDEPLGDNAGWPQFGEIEGVPSIDFFDHIPSHREASHVVQFQLRGGGEMVDL